MSDDPINIPGPDSGGGARPRRYRRRTQLTAPAPPAAAPPPAASPPLSADIAGDVDTLQPVSVSGGSVGAVIGKLIAHISSDPVTLLIAVAALALTSLVGGFVIGERRAVAQAGAPASQTAPPLAVTGKAYCTPPEMEGAALAPPAAGSPYPDDVRLALSFAGVADLRVPDGSRHGSHGWLVGSFGAGDVGHDGAGLSFDGASLVCVPEMRALDSIRHTLELSVWVKPAVIDNRTRNIVSRFSVSGPSDYRLYLDKGYPVFWLNSPVEDVRLKSAYQLEAGVWHHLVVRYNGERLILSVDGQEATLDYSGSISASSAWIEVGSTPYRNEFFIGDIDELVISGR